MRPHKVLTNWSLIRQLSSFRKSNLTFLLHRNCTVVPASPWPCQLAAGERITKVWSSLQSINYQFTGEGEGLNDGNTFSTFSKLNSKYLEIFASSIKCGRRAPSSTIYRLQILVHKTFITTGDSPVPFMIRKLISTLKTYLGCQSIGRAITY